MHRTFSSLHLVAVAALLLAFLAVPAQGQSVVGSGTVFGFFAERLDFTVDASTHTNGHVGGKIVLTTYGLYGSTGKQSYRVESLSVTGSQATVWARGNDKTLHEFIFIDNGDGSVEPDYFGSDSFWPYTPLPLASG